MNYDDPITCLKGIGEKTAALYEKLGIVTIGELMRYYPRSYERFEPPVTIRAAAVMDFAAVRVGASQQYKGIYRGNAGTEQLIPAIA